MKKKRQIFWGVFFILGAIFILVAKMGFMQDVGVWTLIWTVLFAALLVRSLFKISFFGIFFSLAFLGILYAEPLGITAITPWPILGAALLLGIGCKMIFPQKKRLRDRIHFSVKGNRDEEPDRIINSQDGSKVSHDLSFGSAVKYINSENFESASFNCSFGYLKVYFDNAVMKNSSASVHLDNSFGATELYVPRSWTIEFQMENSFGGIDEEGTPQPDGLHTLYLYGDNSFGGITVIYV
ncbi:MAG: intracellular growth attenuator family protein [Lachnospiraceae bacterium]|nr:intracellular growth attenuator family protein [Lachnospiraceae bacterium]